MSFADAWFPHIVCTLTGIVLSGLIGFCQGRKVSRDSEKHTAMLTNLLVVMEDQGHLTLVRDAKGAVTGGRAYVLKAESGSLSLTGYPPVIKQGP
jgi:hypothetical protein